MKQRAVIVIGAVVVAVAALIVLSPGDDDVERSADPPAQSSTAADPSRTDTNSRQTETDRDSATGDRPARTEPEQPKRPDTPLLVAGKVKTITVKKGGRVHFTARSAKDEEVHVHGYDISQDVEAGGSVTLAFKATIEGIFEIEFEGSHEQIGKLVVEP